MDYNLSTIAVTLYYSKTDQSIRQQGHDIPVVHGTVSAVLQYLAIRPPTDGPLFILPLSPGGSSSHVSGKPSGKQALIPPTTKGTRLESGLTTTAAACGLNEGLIKMLGQWTSAAYQAYIRIPPAELASISATLICETNLIWSRSTPLSFLFSLSFSHTLINYYAPSYAYPMLWNSHNVQSISQCLYYVVWGGITYPLSGPTVRPVINLPYGSLLNQITRCKPLSQWPTLSGVKARSTGAHLISATARCTGSNPVGRLLGS